MYKRLLILLPLAWVIALVPHFFPERHPPSMTPPYPGNLACMTREVIYHHGNHADAAVCLRLYGRKIKSIYAESESFAQDLKNRQSVDFHTVHVDPAGLTIAVLSAHSLDEVPSGEESLRVTLNDGTFAVYHLIVEEPILSRATPPASNRHAA